jgi:hypothetical protein
MWANTEYSPEGYRVSIYRTCTPYMEDRSERGQRPNPISSVLCVYSVVLMGRETGSLHLLAPLLLTGGTGADRGKVVLNTVNPKCSTAAVAVAEVASPFRLVSPPPRRREWRRAVEAAILRRHRSTWRTSNWRGRSPSRTPLCPSVCTRRRPPSV